MLLARALVRGAGPRRAAAVAAAAAASTPWRGGSHRHLASAASIWAPSLLADPSPCYRCPTQRTVPAGTATPAVPRLRSMGAVPLVAAAATSAFVRQHQPMMGRASVRFYSSSKHSIVGAEARTMARWIAHEGRSTDRCAALGDAVDSDGQQAAGGAGGAGLRPRPAADRTHARAAAAAGGGPHARLTHGCTCA